ncbi:hypothetical protein BC629DRAFT_587604 [Irpex lacteus]|nr:hypothetical protein BC629DRAFT_587604 [Irpex lacteus]
MSTAFIPRFPLCLVSRTFTAENIACVSLMILLFPLPFVSRKRSQDTAFTSFSQGSTRNVSRIPPKIPTTSSLLSRGIASVSSSQTSTISATLTFASESNAMSPAYVPRLPLHLASLNLPRYRLYLSLSVLLAMSHICTQIPPSHAHLLLSGSYPQCPPHTYQDFRYTSSLATVHKMSSLFLS